jgi:glycosyltransferase involved in cell wall biosynthesis
LPLHIAIDASRATRAQRTGTENYALRLIEALLALDSPHQFTLYFRDQPTPGLFDSRPNIVRRVLPFPRLWTHLRFAAALYHDRPDVIFVPAHTLPISFPGRAIVTIHDLGYVHFPQAHPLRQRLYLDLTTRYSARRASVILADSEATRHDLAAHYQVAPGKIRVVYPGVEGIARTSDAAIATVRQKYRLPERYILFLGTLQPRKNIARLVEAYQSWRLQADSAGKSVALILAGRRGWLSDTLPLNAPGVTVPGYVADADVAALYSGALALAFPSLYEGFGFPVIEAMRCGTPVLCSNTSSLPELAGDAALTVDPLDVNAIRDGLACLVTDSTLRADLVQRGYQQVARFTWRAAAERTLGALEAATQSSGKL